MDLVINDDPIISHFLQSINPADRANTIRELILLGIHTVSNRVHQGQFRTVWNCGCPARQIYSGNVGNFQRTYANADGEVSDQFVQEIRKINQKIDQLSLNFSRGQQTFGKNQTVLQQKKQNQSFKNTEPPVQKQTRSLSDTRVPTQVFRHHLDDSEIKKVMRNPYAPDEPEQKKQKKQSLQKSHQIQKIRDDEDIKRTKYPPSVQYRINQVSREEENTQRTKFKKVKSKIKSLIEKDKIKNKNKSGFSKKSKKNYCQFQYSDEDEFQQESKRSEQAAKQNISGQINESNNYQEYQEYPEQQQHQEESRSESDAISDSSSFSKFSMNSKREAGKISGIRK